MTALPRGRTKSETRKSEDNDFDASGRKARPPRKKDFQRKIPSKSKKKKKKGDQKSEEVENNNNNATRCSSSSGISATRLARRITRFRS